MSAKRFAQLFGDLTAYIGPIKSKTLRWVLIHYWNTANTMYPCKLQLFSAKNPTCSRRVLEIGLENVHTCFVSPCRSVNEILGWFCLTRPKYSQEKKRSNIWRKKTFRNRLTGPLINRTRANFLNLLPKNAVDLRLLMNFGCSSWSSL